MSNKVKPVHSISEIKRTLYAFLEPGQTTEIRAMNPTGPKKEYRYLSKLSGFFDRACVETAAKLVAPIQGESVFFLPNPVVPALSGRAHHRFKKDVEPTSDGNILLRRWLAIECIPARPSGVNATSDERQAASSRSNSVYYFLQEQGWPNPIIACSGNSRILLYRVNLPVEDKGLCRKVLQKLYILFSDVASKLKQSRDAMASKPSVSLNTELHHPSFSLRLFGTKACEGDHLSERPQRDSKILAIPDVLEVVTQEKLEQLLEVPTHEAHADSFLLQNWLTEQGAEAKLIKEDDVRLWKVAVCPWNPGREGHNTTLSEFPSGAIHAKCEHPDCEGKDWPALRDVFEPGWKKHHSSELSDDSEKNPSQSELAELFAQTHQVFAYEPVSGGWYRYQSGAWRTIPEALTQKEVQDFATRHCPEGFSAYYIEGVMKLLKAHVMIERWNNERKLIPFRNGVLNLDTMELQSHTLSNHLTWQLPYDYVPGATCTSIQNWLSETMKGQEEMVELLRAYLAAIIRGMTEVHRFMECVGPGATGKSTFLWLAERLVGSENCFVTELKHLEKTRFESAGVVGKRLMLITDAEKFTGEVAQLKAITGGDPIRIERKYKQSSGLPYKPECMVLIASNETIQSKDYTSGLQRRRILVPFDNQVPQHKRRDLKDEFIIELPGLLNWVLEIPKEEVAHKLKDVEGQVKAMAKGHIRMLLDSNPLAFWLHQNILYDPNAKANIGTARRNKKWPDREVHEKDEEWLFPNYKTFCLSNGYQAVSSRKFSELLDDLCRHQLQLPKARLNPKGREGRTFSGLRIRRTEGKSDLPVEGGDSPMDFYCLQKFGFRLGLQEEEPISDSIIEQSFQGFDQTASTVPLEAVKSTENREAHLTEEPAVGGGKSM